MRASITGNSSIESNMEEFNKLDRNSFYRMTAEESDLYQMEYRDVSMEERLRVSQYLTSMAYGYDMNNPPRLDRSLFSTSKMG
ncbi:MAG: hypothetical protein ABI851_04200 [Saprospiraceae bacterium]